ncbi:hypothetical protein N656DRAFT_219984 [Canariomyces notabilis]|uniref:Uncharacterized protein n=1 Tax=Canariomyces notabilis TaxID=2074819 RepID=A0AAN6TK78_9PEZI|nr:hypothetical protein N656DRAFT_219984 [Canariomyces arenarius]
MLLETCSGWQPAAGQWAIQLWLSVSRPSVNAIRRPRVAGQLYREHRSTRMFGRSLPRMHACGHRSRPPGRQSISSVLDWYTIPYSGFGSRSGKLHRGYQRQSHSFTLLRLIPGLQPPSAQPSRGGKVPRATATPPGMRNMNMEFHREDAKIQPFPGSYLIRDTTHRPNVLRSEISHSNFTLITGRNIAC